MLGAWLPPSCRATVVRSHPTAWAAEACVMRRDSRRRLSVAPIVFVPMRVIVAVAPQFGKRFFVAERLRLFGTPLRYALRSERFGPPGHRQ